VTYLIHAIRTRMVYDTEKRYGSSFNQTLVFKGEKRVNVSVLFFNTVITCRAWFWCSLSILKNCLSFGVACFQNDVTSARNIILY